MLVYTNVIFDIFGVLFEYEVSKFGSNNFDEIFSPLNEGIAIAQRCHKHFASENTGRKLYILSNVESHYLEFLQQRYTDIFNLFEGIVTSEEVGVKKPHIDMYTAIIKKYRLNPADSIFIDDKPGNIVASESAGIKGILCNDFKKVNSELERLLVYPASKI